MSMSSFDHPSQFFSPSSVLQHRGLLDMFIVYSDTYQGPSIYDVRCQGGRGGSAKFDFIEQGSLIKHLMRGGGGVKKGPKSSDVIYGRPLTYLLNASFMGDVRCVKIRGYKRQMVWSFRNNLYWLKYIKITGYHNLMQN